MIKNYLLVAYRNLTRQSIFSFINIGGLAVGLATGFGLAQLAGTLLGGLKMPGALPAAGSALVLLLAAVTASVIPAARAARVDVMQALRSE